MFALIRGRLRGVSLIPGVPADGCSAVFGCWSCCAVKALFDRFISTV
jgi:hypothetical protein